MRANVSIPLESAVSFWLESCEVGMITTRAECKAAYLAVLLTVIRERGSILYLGMAVEILNLP